MPVIDQIEVVSGAQPVWGLDEKVIFVHGHGDDGNGNQVFQGNVIRFSLDSIFELTALMDANQDVQFTPIPGRENLSRHVIVDQDRPDATRQVFVQSTYTPSYLRRP